MMRPEAAEPPEKAAHVKELNVRYSFESLEKVWGALRHGSRHAADSDDISTAQMALLSTHFLSTWGQVDSTSHILFILHSHCARPDYVTMSAIPCLNGCMCCSGCGSFQLGSSCWIFIQTHWPLLPSLVLWTAWPKSLQAHILAPSLIGKQAHYALNTSARHVSVI